MQMAPILKEKRIKPHYGVSSKPINAGLYNRCNPRKGKYTFVNFTGLQ